MICANGQVEIRIGDCRDLLRAMPDQSVNCIVTSPPYFGLRDDGTCWVNLGDSYGATGGNTAMTGGRHDASRGIAMGFGNLPAVDTGLRPKNLLGIPWRVAFALQADGWYLRQDIIWAKPNPMPESVRDRCTKAHEYLFLLTKSARYWYDADAVKERANTPFDMGILRGKSGVGNKDGVAWHAPSIKKRQDDGVDSRTAGSEYRNKRSVWTVATQPYSEAHFATYPPALIEPCILAGCPKSGTVLDPFGGAGTTGLVAARHHRNAILCELNPAYAEMAHKRISREWREPVAVEPEPLGGLFA